MLSNPFSQATYMQDATFWINKLGLKRHPEGGFYVETYRSGEKVAGSALPSRFKSDHTFGTAIYFLLRSEDISAFHRIKSDELWFFHAGSSVDVYFLTEQGMERHRLGNSEAAFQLVVPANTWFGAKVVDGGSFTLVSCTVSPGFEFEDFELASRHDLLSQFPQHEQVVRELTHA